MGGEGSTGVVEWVWTGELLRGGVEYVLCR